MATISNNLIRVSSISARNPCVSMAKRLATPSKDPRKYQEDSSFGAHNISGLSKTYSNGVKALHLSPAQFSISVP